MTGQTELRLDFTPPEKLPIRLRLSSFDSAIGYLSECTAVSEKDIRIGLELLKNHNDETPAYIRFFLRKKSGGKREIRAPVEPLKGLLRLIYREILAPYPLNRHVHGFRPRRTIVTNALAHLTADANHLVNWDIKDCFPSTPIWLIRAAYEDTIGRTLRREGVTPSIVDELIEVLAHLSTLRYGRAETEVLPMGSPTSPCLLNHVLNEFDIRFANQLDRLASREHTVFTYTRYGDDLSVSSPNRLPDALFGIAPSLLKKWGYRVHPEKTKIMHRGSSGPPLEVTGLVIGDGRLLISDHTLRKYELLIMRLLSKPKLRPKEKSILRGIIGITRMIYGPSLAPRIAHALERMRTKRGEDIDRQLIGGDKENSKNNGGGYKAKDIIDSIPTEADDEHFLDPSGLNDPFQHPGSWEDE